MLDTDRLDPYVLWVLEKNGWTPDRVFPQSAAWTAEIERLGHPPFDYGVQVLRSLGGLRFREYHPRSYQKLVQGWRERGLPPERWPKAADIRRKCEASLSVLQRLGLDPDRYNGAAFTFDALDAARDEEVVLDLGLAQKAIGKPLYPIGTAEPDGLVFTAPDHGIYVLFNDGIFSSGRCVEEFLHILFLRGHQPEEVYHID